MTWQASRLERAIITEPGDNHFLTFAAASSGVAPKNHDAAWTDVRTLSVRLDPRGERACAFAMLSTRWKNTSFHDFPIQGPRTTHWLLLEIARGELGLVARHHWWRQAIELSSTFLELTSTSSYVNCLATARSMTNSIFWTWPLCEAALRRLQLWEERYAEKLRASTAGGVSAGHATETTSLSGRFSTKGEARWLPQSWKNGLPHNLPKRRPSSRKDVWDGKNENW